MNPRGKLESMRIKRTETMFTVIGVPDVPGTAAGILTALAKADIPILMIVQNAPDAGSASVTFTVRREDEEGCHKLLREKADELGAEGIMRDSAIARLTVEGQEMEGVVGAAGRFFSFLAEKGINVLAINTTSDTVSCIIEDSKVESALDELSREFNLRADWTP